MPSIRVQTAQNVTLEYEVASLGDRIGAAIIDNIILIAWALACVLLVFKVLDLDRSETGSSVGIVVLGILVGVPYVFYNLLCEVFLNGQSIGKKAVNIRVVRLDGTAPRLGDYLLRWLLRIFDTSLPVVGGFVAIITIAANGKGQRLGDLAAGTSVVKVPRPFAASALPVLAEMPVSYEVVFPQAALLADHDVALVTQLMRQAAGRKDFTLLNEVANKVKSLTGVQTSLQDGPFLKTILRDHAHLAGQE